MSRRATPAADVPGEPGRTRRHALARRGGIGLLVLAMVVAAVLYWLLSTIGGRDLLLRQLVARLPAGTVLTWRTAEGSMAGPLVLRGVHFSMPRQRDPDCVPTAQASCAMGQIVFDADALTLDPALRPLLGRTLRLDALAIAGARLDLPRDDKPFELPRWPDVLPQITLPLALEADAIRIDRLQVLQEGEPLIAIHSASLGLRAASGRLHIEQLRMDSDRGRFTAQGDYLPGDNFRSNLVATAVLPAPAGRTAPRLGLVARGDLSRMDVAIAGRLPAPSRATLTLRGNRDAPRWRLHARSDALDIGLLSGSGETTAPLAFDLRADGNGGRASAQGTFRQGDFVATVQPSRLALEDRRLQLQPLVLDLYQGRIHATGTADLRDPAKTAVELAVNARGLRWASTDGGTTIAGDADLGVAGSLEHWGVKGQARLQRGNQRATVDLAGIGSRDGLTITALTATMPQGRPQGRLQGSGDVTWTPRLEWNAKATLTGFDPGYFAPDWPGAVNGVVLFSGVRRDDGRLLADVEASNLGGILRGRALRGRGKLDIDGDNYAGDVALRLGGSRIDARGTLAAGIDLDVDLAPLQLDDLLPGGRGLLRGKLKLRGARKAPDLGIDLIGDGLAFAGYRAEQLAARGTLPWSRGDGNLVVDARGLAVGIPLTGLQASLRGAVERLQLEAQAQGEIGSLALRGDAARNGARWSGSVAGLHFVPDKGAAWTLQQPARWSWDGRNGALSQACLQAAGGGDLCADADWPRRGLDLHGTGLPLALLAPYLPERSDGRPWVLSGTADLVAAIRAAGASWHGSATLTSERGGVRNRPRARRDVIGYHHLQLDADFDPRQLQATLHAGMDDDGVVVARVATGWDAYAPLDGQLRLRTDDLTALELFSPDIVEPSGKLDVDLRLSGTRGQPAIGGQGRLQAFAAELPALGIALEQGDLRMDAQADGSARILGQMRSGEGLLQVDGSLDWRDASAPLELHVRGQDVLIADTRQLRAVAAPDVVVRYRAGQPLQVSGTVRIPTADIHLERLDMAVSPSPDVVVLDPAEPTPAASPTQLDLDLALEMGAAVKVDGYGLAGTLGGSLRIREPPGRDMRATGALDVAGRYRAYGQNLEITRGRLLWSNSEIGDPRLDVRAERVVGDVTAGIHVEGSASAPRATVYSNPAKSESEALAYLTLGRPLSAVSGAEARQLGAAKAALNAGSGLLAAELGARLGLDDAGVVESRALGSDVLSVGKYLSPRLYVSYGVSLLGSGQVLMLKYLLRKGFDIQIESSTVENRASVNWRKEK